MDYKDIQHVPSHHLTNIDVCMETIKISQTSRRRRVQFVGACYGCKKLREIDGYLTANSIKTTCIRVRDHGYGPRKRYAGNHQ